MTEPVVSAVAGEPEPACSYYELTPADVEQLGALADRVHPRVGEVVHLPFEHVSVYVPPGADRLERVVWAAEVAARMPSADTLLRAEAT